MIDQVTPSNRRALTLFISVIWIGICLSSVHAQDDPIKHIGSALCRGCHEEFNHPRDFCFVNEWKQMETRDPHRNAYKILETNKSDKNLTTPSSEEIIESLGWQKPATEDVRCLSCHIGKSRNSTFASTFDDGKNLGVMCEACHGPASKYRPAHFTEQIFDWRNKTPEEKQELGMVNLRDPETRARVCYSCHIGNHQEGKILTHEMFAAGHPPLPSIDIAAHSDHMHRHWRYLPEKGNFVGIQTYVRLNYKKSVEQALLELPRLKASIIGNIVAFQESVRLVGEMATESQSDSNASNEGYVQITNWPELTAFDCTVCHHALRTGPWRLNPSRRIPDGLPPIPPGRPLPSQWQKEIMFVLLTHLDDLLQTDVDDKKEGLSNQFKKRVYEYEMALAETPFGDPEKIQNAANALVHWMQTDVLDIISEKINFDQNFADGFIQKLKPESSFDFHATRQLGWIARSINLDRSNNSRPVFDRSENTDGITRERAIEIGDAHFKTWNEWDQRVRPLLQKISTNNIDSELFELTFRGRTDFTWLEKLSEFENQRSDMKKTKRPEK